MNNDGPYPNAPRGPNPILEQGQLASPPYSGGGGPNGPMNGGFPPGPRSAGGPSPPPSVGRSSTATDIYARSESGRSGREINVEAVLGEHYVALKRYLSQTSRDGKPNPPANKARDKLQRLTGVQFLELSTDVFDELLRRQAFSRRPPNAPPSVGPPPYLIPEDTFHPKRNQARQKLSSLGPPRFRDLATDVFCELERRYPRFVAGDIPRLSSPVSTRAPSRAGTPMGGYPPRGMGRRQPSNASSIRGAGSIVDGYDIPPSPGMPPSGYDRPTPKQFQSNTIIPNKSTMLEEDDEGPDDDQAQDAYALGGRNQNGIPSENDKRIMDDYEAQIRELREKLDSMEDQLKKKDDEMNEILDGERSRSTAASAEKTELSNMRLGLESQLAEAQNLNDSLREQLDRLRDDYANETRQLRDEIEEARSSVSDMGSGRNDPELVGENEELRAALDEQRQTTMQVRREAQEFLREMKMLSAQSGSSWAKQGELEKTIETLELEVKDWRNRYARARTQLRSMRSSSMSMSLDQDAGRYVREKGFTDDSGLVKDVHVTKFQVAIDELLRRARVEEPDKVIDSMKSVVMSVRRITKDLDAAPANNDQSQQQRKQLKSRVSSMANNLITAAKTFASSAGMSPLSVLDAAASNLVGAIVDLLRLVKIRTTPDGELEEEDDGTATPVGSVGVFSPRTAKSQSIQSAYQQDPYPQDLPPPPPPFQGLGRRSSMDSSAYSPLNSPRESVETYNKSNGNGFPPASNGYGMRRVDSRTEDLKVYLDDQTAILVQTIQSLVGLIRGAADISRIEPLIRSIVETVGKVISETDASGNGDMIGRLADSQQRLMEAGERGQELAADGKDERDREWRMWTQTLPPIAFEIARETKELVQRVGQLVSTRDDFS
ncbi:component of the polarisome [Diaporthe australafricana]|uniref:Component of the polarisome n=1 Tax=Diaporthe australafricana TaxID=127596 RepID=A0ABR3Y2G4_9PEZI